MWMPLLAAIASAAPPLEAVVLTQQGSTTCAGAVISPEGLIATAYHCVAAGGRPEVRLRDGRAAVGKVIAARPSADLALILAPDLAVDAWLPVAGQVPGPGADVTVLGHPYGNEAPSGFLEGTLRWSVSEGVVSAVGPRAVQFDAPVNPGNSGGPVVDRDGRLIAVVSRKSAGGEGLGFGGRSEILADMVDRPPRGLTPFGGTVAAEVGVSVFGSDHGVVALAPRVEAAFRDRVVVSGAWGFGATARWDAVRFGRVEWLGPEATVAVRQRVFRGPWTVRLDAFGGAAGLMALEGAVRGGEVDLDRDVDPVLLGGAAIRVRRAGFEFSVTEEGDTRASLWLRWPGVLGVF